MAAALRLKQSVLFITPIYFPKNFVGTKISKMDNSEQFNQHQDIQVNLKNTDKSYQRSRFCPYGNPPQKPTNLESCCCKKNQNGSADDEAKTSISEKTECFQNDPPQNKKFISQEKRKRQNMYSKKNRDKMRRLKEEQENKVKQLQEELDEKKKEIEQLELNCKQLVARNKSLQPFEKEIHRLLSSVLYVHSNDIDNVNRDIHLKIIQNALQRLRESFPGEFQDILGNFFDVFSNYTRN